MLVTNTNHWTYFPKADKNKQEVAVAQFARCVLKLALISTLAIMKFHDYHLESYKVLERGETIEFHLVFGYPGEVTDESDISFSGVALYHFINSHGTIITDIREVPLAEYLQSMGDELSEWNRMYGVKHWQSDISTYIGNLQGMGFKVWEIISAIGFYGFIVAKEVANT